MNSTHSTFAVSLTLAVLGALAVGAYLFFQDIYQFLQTLDRQVAAGIVAVLVAALYIGLSIRRAGQMKGVQRMRLGRKAESYARFLEAWSGMPAGQGERSENEAASAEIKAAKRELLLWASIGVLKQLAAYERLNAQLVPSDPAVRPNLENLLRAMRSDLGENSLGLGEGDLTSLLTPDGPQHAKSTIEHS